MGVTRLKQIDECTELFINHKTAISEHKGVYAQLQ